MSYPHPQSDENRDSSAPGENQRFNASESHLTADALIDKCSGHVDLHDISPETMMRLDLARKKELARVKLGDTLAKYQGFSLIATFVLMSLAAFNPSADKAFVKDLIPIVLGPQSTLLGVIVGYYFGAKAN
jgi:hypothetical protein